MKSLAFAAASCLMSVAAVAAGTDYYVDDDGSDSNAGLSAESPMKTFSSLFGKYDIGAGDKVHVAEGVYNEGVMTSGTSKYRLVVPAGVEVVGAGAGVTAIEGAAHTNELGEVASLVETPFGCGANALRAVHLGNGAVLRGVTVTKGYSPNYSDGSSGNGGGVVSASGKAGYIIDCVVTGCVGARGAGSIYTRAIRCDFHSNRSGNTGSDIWSGAAFNCRFGDVLSSGAYNIYQGGPYVNNTFWGSGYSAHAASGSIVLYNSLVLKSPNKGVCYSNCVVSTTGGTACPNTVKVDGANKAFVDADMRPLRNSPCINVGDVAHFDLLPDAMAAAVDIDRLGEDRIVDGAIDAGALESFFGKTSAYDWYVDADQGDDANDGTGKTRAFRTLARAVTNSYLRAGDTIRALPGVYSNGVVVGKWRFRAVVPAGVTLLGENGPEATMIVGEPDLSVAQDVSPFGCGPEAVRCVRIGEGSVVRGFTLTGGRATGFTGNDFGGAVYCGDDRMNAQYGGYVVDCIVTNNFARRGGGVFAGISVGCRFKNNFAYDLVADNYGGTAVNCDFGDVPQPTQLNAYLFSNSRLVNCTFTGGGKAAGCNNAAVGAVNCVMLKDIGDNITITNCVYSGSLGRNSYAVGSIKVASDEAAKLDGEGRALRGSPALDAGSREIYDAILADAPESVRDCLAADCSLGDRVQGLALDIGAFESSASTAPVHWYVNAAEGGDSGDGSQGQPYKTLAAAMANPRLVRGDTVNAAGGTYAGEPMTVGSRKYRVAVPAGVTLKGAGAESTVIEGGEDLAAGEDSCGCGPAAVSCVYLNEGATIAGFTLTKGRTPSFTENSYGAAVHAVENDNAYVVDCVITNNFANRGAGLWHGTAVRCRFRDNGVKLTGTDIFQGRAWNSIFGDIVFPNEYNIYQGGPYVNCLFYGQGKVSNSYSDLITNIFNAVVLREAPGTRVKLVNSITTAPDAFHYDAKTVKMTLEEMKLGPDYKPLAGSPLIDRADSALYASYPEGVMETLAGLDAARSQRIYNGRLDIGPFEYDWREDFAKGVGRSASVEVIAASEGVALASRALALSEGDAFEFNWSLRHDGNYRFRISGGGEATVLLNGEELLPDGDGVYRFAGAADTSVSVRVECSEGAVEIGSFRNDLGVYMLVR
jgi:hypothetical protein